jgi:DNA-binding transcriptional MerR regulator
MDADEKDRDTGLMSPGRLAEMLDIPPDTVKAWRARNAGPVYYRIGKHVRYDERDVRDWLATWRRDGGGTA